MPKLSPSANVIDFAAARAQIVQRRSLAQKLTSASPSISVNRQVVAWVTVALPSAIASWLTISSFAVQWIAPSTPVIEPPDSTPATVTIKDESRKDQPKSFHLE